MCVKHFFKLCDLRLFATEILRYKRNLSRFGFTCIFFMKNLTLLFWRLKAIRRKLRFNPLRASGSPVTRIFKPQ